MRARAKAGSCIVVLALAGCTGTPELAESTTAVSTPSASASQATPPRNESDRLGPTGLGAITIGMSAAQMDKLAPSLGLTGLPSNFSPDPDAFCNYWANESAGLGVKSTNGDAADSVFEIDVYGDSAQGRPSTPEGVGLDSTLAQVKAAYPGGEDLGGDAYTGYLVDLPGPAGMHFVFADDADRVRLMTLMADKWLDYDETCG